MTDPFIEAMAIENASWEPAMTDTRSSAVNADMELVERLFTAACRDDLPQNVRFDMKLASEALRRPVAQQPATAELPREVAVLLARHDYRFGMGGKNETGYAFANSYKFKKRAAEVLELVGRHAQCAQEPCPYAIDGCVLENQEIGPCLCALTSTEAPAQRAPGHAGDDPNMPSGGYSHSDRHARSIAWAASRWNAEVANRPLRNVHRRSLDDTWRQVIRHFGGDDAALCGPTHDELVNGGSAVTSTVQNDVEKTGGGAS